METGGQIELKPETSGSWLSFGLLAFIFTVAVIITDRLVDRGGYRLFAIAGGISLLISSIFMFLPFYYLKKFGKVKEGRPYYETNKVVKMGPYRFLRHPQYFGYILLNAGFALLSQHILVVFFSVLAILFLYLEVRKEEKLCLQHLGEPYRDYMNSVPRFNLIAGLIRRFKNL